MGRYLVFDLETETYQSYKRKANPFDERNWVVARGWKRQGDAHCSYTYHPVHDRTTYLRIPEDVTLLVGFNIKFDLLWEMAQGNPDLHAFFCRGGAVWCCQYAEYLIRGQHPDAQMCSLDSIIESYGGKKKIDEVKALWNAGVRTADIPQDLLIDYLVGTPEEERNGGDIRNTELVFLGQLEKANAQGQVPMIQDRMDGLCATTDMEFRGVKVDVHEAGRRLVILNKKLDAANEELMKHLPADLPFEFSWSSPAHKSCLIFGGTVKYQLRRPYIDEATGELARLKAKATWPVFQNKAIDPEHPNVHKLIKADGTTYYEVVSNGKVLARQDQFVSGQRKGEYKTKQVDVPGEIKVKWQDFFYELPGYTKPKPQWKGSLTDGRGAPLYSTDKKVMEELFLLDIPFLKTLKKQNGLNKEIGTYYARQDKNGEWTGMLTMVQRHDHMLHHNLNHTITVTTRLSSSEPNLQNLTRNDKDDDGEAKSEVKKMFVSRFGPDGCVIEADYSQLEVVVQGVLSGDANLCEDLRQKIDFHCKRVSAKHNKSYEECVDWCKNEEHPDYKYGKKERTKCKIFSFQRAYGAGAALIAAETKMDIDEVKDLIEKEDAMYPGVVLFNAEVESAVMRSSVPFNAPDDFGNWKTYHRGQWQSPTGTIYSFRSHDAPEFLQKRGTRDSYSPTELKNYPVQGTGGEFVQERLGKLWRHFISVNYYDHKAYLINTVHDCVWADSYMEVRDQVAADIKRIMEGIPEYFNERYGMNITVPFPAEVEWGYNFNELKHLH
jgi:DNA polymerase-1